MELDFNNISPSIYRQEILGLGHLLFMVTNKAVLSNAIFALFGSI